MKRDNPRYSYRQAPNLAGFSGEGPHTIMDAHCALCAKGARWIARNDKAAEFTIIPVQSSLGSALLHHYGMDPEDPTSWLYLADGHAYSSLDALIRVGQRLGGIWRGLIILRMLPRALQDWLYGSVARNRIRLMGRADLCAMPDLEVQKRLHK